MKVIIAGSRGIVHTPIVQAAMKGAVAAGVISSEFDVEEVVSGMCPNSPDMAAITWAQTVGIPVHEMPAAWVVNGRKDPKAGNRRNVEMAKYVGKNGALVAVWDGYSHGTKHMISAATSRGLKVYVHRVEIPVRK